jgi:hypothetical protein
MKIIKSVVIVSLMLGAPALFAKQNKDGVFANNKQKMISYIDKQVLILQELKSCISLANNGADMNNCRIKNKSSLNELNKNAKANVKKMKKERKAQMEQVNK